MKSRPVTSGFAGGAGPSKLRRMSTDRASLKQTWKTRYANVPAQLAMLGEIGGAASVFNSNIDAVRKVKPAILQQWIAARGGDPARFLAEGTAAIHAPDDVLRGFLFCFARGIAREWLVSAEETFAWMRDTLGHDRLQMGGQGGIIANVLATCGVRQVYAHCASLPTQQAGLFVDLPSLLSTDADGRLAPAHGIHRDRDLPLIHWILEFDRGDRIEIGGQTITCPKSNRFIATWDPLNFRLAIDDGFDRALRDPDAPLDYALLAGYQMLQEPLADGTSAMVRIEASLAAIAAWRASHPALVVHFEFASTQDAVVRKYLLDRVARQCDSCGLNEQELIDILDVMGEAALAAACRSGLGSDSLVRGLEAVYRHLGIARVQLHMFGLFVTLQRPGHAVSPEAAREGMALAATVSAAKAGTGSIEVPENLLWAHGREVGDASLAELERLAGHVAAGHGPDAAASLLTGGIVRGSEWDMIAVPTILIDKPLTLVGMGDTISSLSLLGARG